VRDEFLEGERFGAEVRAFIAERAPRIRLREGAHVPREAGQEREIRRWLGKLHAVGYLGAGWPPGRGGRSGHRLARDLILMEKLFRARAYRPLDQVMLASHAILAFGTDAQKDEYLPPTCSARASPGASCRSSSFAGTARSPGPRPARSSAPGS
jgi:alkylation response protein AidB-like acyl-CoA dehydrogenase